MKIAVAASGKEINSEVSPMGGKAPYYLILEDEMFLESIKNPFIKGSGGAGFSIAYMLAGKGVDAVIAGRMGDNMKTALKEGNIKFAEEGDRARNAEEAVRSYLGNNLNKAV
jgi:predicted Fe-Mo cluster-binding NifX family protein